MGYKHQDLTDEQARAEICKPTYMLKIMPGYDGKPRICELACTTISEIEVKGEPGRVRPGYSCSPTLWRPWPICRFLRSCPPVMSSPISLSGMPTLSATISTHETILRIKELQL
jgi:hypothetical protein